MKVRIFILLLLLIGCQRVKIAQREYQLNLGEEAKISVQGAVNPQDLAWYSTQPQIAAVNDSGVVSGVSLGEAYIRMVLSANDQLLDSVKIVVTEAP